jgi:hypothetical protein
VICSPLFLTAQISENFSDRNFSSNPQWFGDTTHFVVNENEKLQLQASGAGSSLLLTQSNFINNCEWQFYIQLAFSPSANNNVRVYLSSDNADLKADLNGYFLQFGESGSDDAIELFRQNGQSITSICRGTESIISKSFKLGIKVLHNLYGSWEIYTDQLDGNGFILETSGFDNEINVSNNFGFLCKYTASNSEKFYFDDILIRMIGDPIKLDSILPQISKINCISKKELEILFSEEVLVDSVKNNSNYFVSDGIENPDSIYVIDDKTIRLHFSNEFVNRKTYSLFVSDIFDMADNKMMDTVLYFSYFEAEPLDIIINEIMDDPSPVVGLPNIEYLELYNNSVFDIDLKGWQLEINESVNFLETFVLPAHNFLIICNSSATEEMNEYGHVYSLSGFSLLNAGSDLRLKNQNGVLISSFSYTKNQFNDDEKLTGGWSLEQINPQALCFGIDNWEFSIHTAGGSPGRENSIYDPNPSKPEITSFQVLGDSCIQLEFKHKMDSLSLSNMHFYKIIETEKNPDRIKISIDQKSVLLIFHTPFVKSQTSTLKISSELKNCLGESMTEDRIFSFVLPDKIELNDIVLNEILFQPLNQGEEYIEIYNRTTKIFDFSDLKFCLIKDDFPNPPDTNCVNVSLESKLFYPATYFILSRSPENVFEQYLSPNPDNFITIPNLPRLVDDGGIISLKNNIDATIDKVEYDEKMHYPLLNYTEGVALEKIHYNLPGYVKSNWLSASFASGFGTPAYENSQFSEFTNESSQITISPHVFTPNNDGRDDFLKIEYQLEKSGYTANVIIFNSEGVRIKQIVKNELLGTKGSFYWKGLDKNSTKMTRGIYIIFIELFDLKGNVKRFKETVVLAEAF